MAFPVLRSKLVRILSIIPKLCLRPSADFSGHLTCSVKLTCLRLSTQRCSFKLHFDQRRKLDAASKARRSARITITFPVRSTPVHAAYHRRRLLAALSIDQPEWLDELRLREFHEGGWVIEQLQMIQGV